MMAWASSEASFEPGKQTQICEGSGIVPLDVEIGEAALLALSR
jgi:hypothetical protein